MTPSRQTPSSSPTPIPADPTQVIPCVAPRVHVRADENGSLHIRKEAESSKRMEALFQKFFGWRRDRYVNLDERGTEFWKLIDGERTLAEIATLLSEVWTMEIPECKKAVIVYTRALMIRHLVVLVVKTEEGGVIND